MTPALENINYYNNDVFEESYTITDEDDAAVDLSDKSLVFTIKKKKAESIIESLTSASGISVGGASNNIITFSGDFDLEERDYYYDLHNITDNETIMYGRFKVTGEVHE